MPFLIEPAELLSTYQDLLLLDTRPAEQYAAGHIPGAVNLCTYDRFVKSTSPIGLGRFQRAMADLYGQAGVDTARAVVVYEAQTGMRAARECWMLAYLGHPDVRMLHGGLQAWQQAGGPLSAVAVSLERASFSLNPQGDMVMGVRGILAEAGLPDFTLLDVRSKEEFTGAGGPGCCPRQGRIPGALWLEWTELLDDAGRFKPPEAVRLLLQDRGINPDHDIVPYCHRGARSAVAYYALRIAGCRQVRNFIGSWHEWAARNDLPIESGI
jgi:thiosulfate/3-mercaptopyruvate sulfurtransferase